MISAHEKICSSDTIQIAMESIRKNIESASPADRHSTVLSNCLRHIQLGTGDITIRQGAKIGVFHIDGMTQTLVPEADGTGIFEAVTDENTVRLIRKDSSDYNTLRITVPREPDEHIEGYARLEDEPVCYYNREHGGVYQPSLETFLSKRMGLYAGRNIAYAMHPQFTSSKGYRLEVYSEKPVVISYNDDATVIDCFGLPEEIRASRVDSFSPPRLQNEFVRIPEGTDNGVAVVMRGDADEIRENIGRLLEAGCALGYVQLENIFGSVSHRLAVSDRVVWGSTKIKHGYKELIRDLQAQGIEVIGYINPYMEEEANLFAEFDREGYFVSHEGRRFDTSLINENRVCIVDLFNPAARRALMERYGDAFAQLGISSFKLDFGEGHPDKSLHQRYAAELVRFGHDIQKYISEQTAGRGFFYSRTATGANVSATYGQDPFLIWGGDYTANFRNDSWTAGILRSVDAQSIGLPGYFEIGGFYNFGWLYNNPVFMRACIEAGMFNLFVRSHVGADHRWPLNTHVYSENVIDLFAVWSRVRFGTLKPFFDEQTRHWNKTGQPIWKKFYPRHHGTPGITAKSTRNQFYIGAENDILLAIPSRDRPFSKRYKVCLPPDGSYTDLITGEHIETGTDPILVQQYVRGGAAIYYDTRSRFADLFAAAHSELETSGVYKISKSSQEP
ncbi:MAG: Alpha-xylosidase [candidate division WS6 bacterium OLB20]|uniref:Alpha-xylosidase n=1 Tax=candidate division WS6 bacterium OLB20 TaxID=1617426 RepID=A0A136LWT0_9BACT|nr:MAG: Alpha-xylosidase [candidate division WS6 bacterium OLB20]